MRVMIRGNWAPYVGTDYCEVLGIYDSLDCPDCKLDAESRAWDTWQGETEDESGFEDEGPDYWVEEYDPDVHDGLEAGGDGEGTGFRAEFERIEK